MALFLRLRSKLRFIGVRHCQQTAVGVGNLTRLLGRAVVGLLFTRKADATVTEMIKTRAATVVTTVELALAVGAVVIVRLCTGVTVVLGVARPVRAPVVAGAVVIVSAVRVLELAATGVVAVVAAVVVVVALGVVLVVIEVVRIAAVKVVSVPTELVLHLAVAVGPSAVELAIPLRRMGLSDLTPFPKSGGQQRSNELGMRAQMPPSGG